MGNALWGTTKPDSGHVDTPNRASHDPTVKPSIKEPVEIVVLGTGAGATYIYHKQSSSSFVVFKDGEPVLLCDLGYGVTASCLQLAGRIPPHIYISHNHGDHSGELPLVLGVEGAAAVSGGRERLTVYSHPDVMAELQPHRLREMRSTGHPLGYFADFVEVPPGCRTAIGDTGLAVQPHLSQHSETCYGLVLYDEGRPVLGWTADSGYKEDLYLSLAEADTLLVDARLKGTVEHAGFEELHRLDELPALRGKTVYITGYGRQDEAPKTDDLPCMISMYVARPGMRIQTCPPAVRAEAADKE